MIKKKRLALILTAFLAALMLASVSFAYAEGEESASEEPLREVHKVAVGEKTYCFFVTNNVVMTPDEVSSMSDEELTAWILGCAGLYMKETNCKEESHIAITAEDWIDAGGRFMLSDEDLAGVREAAPAEGKPVKLYMDLKVSDKPAPEDPEQEDTGNIYWTYKKVSPDLIFIVVATEADAATPEDICEAPAREPEKQPEEPKKVKMPKMPKVSESGEMLPEYRTINMADRSGKPVEDTLQDGTPVTLEWIEPSKRSSDEGSFIDHIPGRYAGLAVILGALAALIIILIRRRKEDED